MAFNIPITYKIAYYQYLIFTFYTCTHMALFLFSWFGKLFLGGNVGANEAYFIIDLWLAVDWLVNLVSDLTKHNT